MPYSVRQNGENYDVINTETSDVKATHEPPDAKEKAERQVKLLNEIDGDSSWDEENASD